ncbi:hypothetical protein DNU06_05925 [Putridiphycobacter roseus]|uniref:Uncharacterized protein n=1 Tax=Putridiphycobacter roseus TaxID=2219161 RepID=A0A2W1NGD0_9FLAO|nr:hypothetical protein DNU06_05925 [Putridiphycobacter roseus]
MTEASDSSGLEGTGYETTQVTEDLENGSLYNPQPHATFFPTPQVTEASDSSGLEGTDYEATQVTEDFENGSLYNPQSHATFPQHHR